MADRRHRLTDPESRELARKMLLDGASDAQIADAFGMTKSGARGWRHREGLPCAGSPEWQALREKLEHPGQAETAAGTPPRQRVPAKPNRTPWPLTPWQMIPNVNNSPCPVAVGDPWPVKPRDAADWSGAPETYQGGVAAVYPNHRWFRVVYRVGGTVLSEGFKY